MGGIVSKSRPEVDQRLYFGALNVLLVEPNQLELEILTQVFTSFKVRSAARMKTTTKAQNHLDRDAAQLVVVGSAQSGDGPDEYDFIRWIRRSRIEALRTTSIILLAGHMLQPDVIRARDCGANFVIAKPITPKILYDRVVWLAKDQRPFIEHPNYTGPDRRFQSVGPPPGVKGRRHDECSVAAPLPVPPVIQLPIDPATPPPELHTTISGRGTARP